MALNLCLKFLAQKEIRRFGTMTELIVFIPKATLETQLTLALGLRAWNVVHVADERSFSRWFDVKGFTNLN